MVAALFLWALATLSEAASGPPPTSVPRAEVAAQQGVLKSSSPTSNVAGLVFDRFVTIWLENTDYDKAKGDPNLAALAKQGITLSNYFGVTHPSEPNYMASVMGDNFGNDNDNVNSLPKNVSSIVDLLEDKGISWAEYQEDMPYAGFQGGAYVNQQTHANDYVRKHNPLVMAEANSQSDRRLSQMKNLTDFYKDLKANQLPQWMFVTPNMTSDGHDSSVTVAGTWTANFLKPLLTDPNFLGRTLVLVTFDENHTYSQQNRVFSILLGDAVPEQLKGTTDANFYSHYSEMSTVEANWGLDTLGRWDVGANVFKLVADASRDTIRTWSAATGATPGVFLNQSYAGYLNSRNSSVGIPKPNLNLTQNGRAVSAGVRSQWSGAAGGSIYQNSVEIPDGLRPPPGY